MLRKGDSRGLSTIVATLLIILITLVAVGIIWVVVRNVIQQDAEQVSLGKFTLNLEISQVQKINDSALNVKVKRNTGDGEFVGINFIIDDGDNTEIVKTNISLKELEARNFELHLIVINASKIKKISIVPIFKLESGKEVTGDVKDEYIPSTSSGTGGITCTPNCVGRICGLDPVCGQSCGTCSTGTCNATGQCVTTALAWQTGMVSWWKFNGDASDSIGTNDGTVNGATLTNTGCKSGQCYSFDGVNDYIRVSDSNSLDMTNALTISAWFKIPATIAERQVIVGKNYTEYEVGIYPSGLVHTYTSDGSTDYDEGISAYIAEEFTESDWLPNKWYNLVWTLNGRHEIVYINGIKIGEGDKAHSGTKAGTSYLNIGSRTGYYLNFNGLIDEVMIFNRTLSSNEVQQIYSYSYP